jgi:choline kinase
MKLILLAAGKSSRIFRDIGYNKCLIKIKGKSLIRHIIDNAILNDINDISIVVGYKSKKIIDHLSEYRNLKFIYNKKYNTTDMVYSAYLAFKNSRKDVLITYTDIFYNKSLFSKIKKNRLRNITVPYLTNWQKIWKIRKKNIFKDAETFYRDKKNNLIEIGKKINKANLKYIKGQFMGLIFIPKSKIYVAKNFYLKRNLKKKIQFTEFLNALVEDRINVKCIEYKNYWYEIDDKNDLKNMLLK